jgi:hypothetical protein
MRSFLLCILSSVLLWISACSAGTPTVTPQLVTVYSTLAAQPWLPEVYECAGHSLVVSRVEDPSAADIALRIGEPEWLTSPAYQIDTEEILIVTHRQSPVQNLTLEEARALFAGQGDPSVEVLVYASGEDLQEVFDRSVMQGSRIAPSARLVADPQRMSDTLVNETSSVGILPRRWKAGNTRDVFSIGPVPVLAIMPSEPEGAIEELIVCLQQ